MTAQMLFLMFFPKNTRTLMPLSIGNYLIKRQSERYIIMTNIAKIELISANEIRLLNVFPDRTFFIEGEVIPYLFH